MFLTLVVIAVLLFWLVKLYNRLQAYSHVVREGHSNIMASMKKRVDLVNRLADVVKGYADHEKLTLLSAGGDSMAISGDRATDERVLLIQSMAQRFPDLKADGNFKQYSAQLESIEADLQGKRETYNRAAREYNTYRAQLPQSLFADKVGFDSAAYFNVESADALENLKDFQSADAGILRAHFGDAGRKLVETSREMSSMVGGKLRALQAPDHPVAGTDPTVESDTLQSPPPAPGSQNLT